MKTSPKDRIMESAIKLFSTKGFDATSVDEIAKDANINKAMIYYYFSSKDGLLVSIIRRSIDEFYRIVEEMDIKSFASLKDFIRTLVVHLVDYITTHKDIVKIFFREGFIYGDKIGSTVSELISWVFENLISKIKNKFNLSDNLSYVDCAIMTNLVAGMIHLENRLNGEESEFIKNSYIDKITNIMYLLVMESNSSGGEI